MKTIILIPYRNREEHLKYFLENTAPKLKERIENLEILIIEQSDDGKLFNRGKVLNVGFKYYDNDEYYYITQDVDTNPKHETAFYHYKNEIPNFFFRIYSSFCNTLGGIVKFKGNIFREVNGFPNNYWGWGQEDIVLMRRAQIKCKIGDMKKNKFILSKNRRRHIFFHNFEEKMRKLSSNHKSKKKLTHRILNTEEEKEKYIYESGLNNLDYKIIKEEDIDFYIKKIVIKI